MPGTDFLIMTKNCTNADPVKNEIGCYKLGDIVNYAPAGTFNGAEEGLPTFVTINVSDLEYSTVVKYDEKWTGKHGQDIIEKGRRRYAVLDTLVQQAINAGGFLTLTLAQANAALRDKTKE